MKIKLTLPSKKFYFNKDNVTIVEMFNHSVLNSTKLLGLIGSGFLADDWKMLNPMFIAINVDLIAYLTVSFQNIYAFHNDFVSLIFCTVTLGMGFQSIAKLQTFIYKRNNSLKLISYVENYIKDFAARGKSSKFDYWLMMYTHLSYAGTALFSLCGLLIFSYPMIYYLFFGEIILHFGFIIPGTDWKTVPGYILNFLFHTFQIYAVCVAFTAAMVVSIFFMLNALAQYGTLQDLLDDLDELTRVNCKNGEKLLDIKACIGDITNLHVKLLE